MKNCKTLIVLFLIGISIAAISPFGKTIQPVNAATVSTPPPTAWSKTYGGTGNDIAYSVIQTNDGGYALAGSTTSFGSGGADFYLVKTASTKPTATPTPTSSAFPLHCTWPWR